MPRPKSSVPSYLLHKPTGQARVRIAGRDFHLGPFGSDQSRRKYGELIAQHCSGRTIDPVAVTSDPSDPGPSVAELWLAFLEHAEAYYVKGDKVTAEVA